MYYTGCAGSLKPTRLSLQSGELQGDFAKVQGQSRLKSSRRRPRLNGLDNLSLFQGAGRPSFRGREGSEEPRLSPSSVQGALPGSFRRSTHGSLMSPSDPKRTSPQRRLFMACPGRRPRTKIGLCHRAERRVPRHAGDPLLQSGLPPPVAYCQGAGPFPRQCSGNLSDRVLHDGGQLRLE
jgi:hypothetical protein